MRGWLLLHLHEHVDKMMANLYGTAEWLKAKAYMVEMAYLRVLASVSAAYIQGRPFKGVNDKPARGRAVSQPMVGAAARDDEAS